jgi:hypothetical protein
MLIKWVAQNPFHHASQCYLGRQRYLTENWSMCRISFTTYEFHVYVEKGICIFSSREADRGFATDKITFFFFGF